MVEKGDLVEHIDNYTLKKQMPTCEEPFHNRTGYYTTVMPSWIKKVHQQVQVTIGKYINNYKSQ